MSQRPGCVRGVHQEAPVELMSLLCDPLEAVSLVRQTRDWKTFFNAQLQTSRIHTDNNNNKQQEIPIR